MHEKKVKKFAKGELKPFVIDNLCKPVDIEVVILRGHILLEYILNNYLDAKAGGNGDFDISKFTFSQKLYLFKMFCKSKIADEVYENILLINKLRNDIAHNLIYNKRHLATLLSYVKKIHPKIEEIDNEVGQTFAVVSFVCALLSSAIDNERK